MAALERLLRKMDLWKDIEQRAGDCCNVGQYDDVMLRLRSCGLKGTRAVGRFGTYSPRKNLVTMTTLDCSPEKYEDTLRHEVAHLVDFAIRGKTNHDSWWKGIARKMGANPSSRGSDERFSAAAQAKREALGKIVARCTKCDHEIIRMKRSRRDWSRFTHRGCGGRFTNVC